MSDLASLQRDLVVACQIMDRMGLTEAFGHVSIRLPGTDRVLLTPRGAPGSVTEDQITVIDLEGRKVEGRATPAHEYAIHTRIYLRRPDVGAICRTHSPAAMAFSMVQRSIRPAHGFGTFLGEEVRVYPKPFLIDNPQLGDELAEMLGDAGAVLLRGNGTAVVGRDIREACVKAIFLEEEASLQLQALTLGQPIPYSPEERAHRTNLFYDVYGRAWEYYKRKFGLA